MSIIEKLGITPGPWSNGKYTSDIMAKDGYMLFSRTTKSGFTSATQQDCMLCASAQEMLEALIFGVKMIESMPDFIEIDSYEYDFRNMAIDAIEKATGRSWSEIKELL